MTAFLFALVAAFAAGFGARDQQLVAGLRDRLGQSAGLLWVAVASAVATAFAAAWFGMLLGTSMSMDAATMFVAIALLVASVECAWPVRRVEPVEPTRSLGAISIVLFARQLTDAARFLVLAVAAAYAAPEMAALGGAVGGAASVAFGWLVGGEGLARLPVSTLRRLLAAILLLMAILTGLSARGLIG